MRLACLFFILILFVPSIQAKTFVVTFEVEINTGDWFPLPEEDMKAAAVDTALAELTNSGLFTLAPQSAEKKSTVNNIQLLISLIGPAEAAKLTIMVNLVGHATYISTASISVHDMDY
ncbi:MAG: hypothetical protein COB77_05570 [Gammaproteobacteria bacterium]|nr:MAG: hypothetical protein COB77_05570 [Gammaproteobacteria bacterium]